MTYIDPTTINLGNFDAGSISATAVSDVSSNDIIEGLQVLIDFTKSALEANKTMNPSKAQREASEAMLKTLDAFEKGLQTGQALTAGDLQNMLSAAIDTGITDLGSDAVSTYLGFVTAGLLELADAEGGVFSIAIDGVVGFLSGEAAEAMLEKLGVKGFSDWLAQKIIQGMATAVKEQQEQLNNPVTPMMMSPGYMGISYTGSIGLTTETMQIDQNGNVYDNAGNKVGTAQDMGNGWTEVVNGGQVIGFLPTPVAKTAEALAKKKTDDDGSSDSVDYTSDSIDLSSLDLGSASLGTTDLSSLGSLDPSGATGSVDLGSLDLGDVDLGQIGSIDIGSIDIGAIDLGDINVGSISVNMGGSGGC